MARGLIPLTVPLTSCSDTLSRLAHSRCKSYRTSRWSTRMTLMSSIQSSGAVAALILVSTSSISTGYAQLISLAVARATWRRHFRRSPIHHLEMCVSSLCVPKSYLITISVYCNSYFYVYVSRCTTSALQLGLISAPFTRINTDMDTATKKTLSQSVADFRIPNRRGLSPNHSLFHSSYQSMHVADDTNEGDHRLRQLKVTVERTVAEVRDDDVTLGRPLH